MTTTVRRRLAGGIRATLLAAAAVVAGAASPATRTSPAAAEPPTTAAPLECTACHPKVHEARLGTGPEWSRACTGCHEHVHAEIRTLYAGSTAAPAVAPDPMSVARVGCRGCHTDEALNARGEAARVAALQRACTACHGERYAFMLPQWRAAAARRTHAVQTYVASANADTRLRRPPEAVAALRAATERLSLVLRGDGLHNPAGADALLRSALDGAAAAYRAAGVAPPSRPALGPDPATNACATCHYGVETVLATLGGKRFSHADHVVDGDVACTTCHSDATYFRAGGRSLDPRHGRTSVGTADCSSCHHRTSGLACTACHAPAELPARAAAVTMPLRLRPAGAPATREVAFRHAVHAAVACERCHTSPRTPRATAACSTCHEAHHRDATACATCHGTNVKAAHEAKDHLACTQCHARETVALLTMDRPFCLTCHTDRADHQPGRECAPCHMQLTPAQLREKILGER